MYFNVGLSKTGSIVIRERYRFWRIVDVLKEFRDSCQDRSESTVREEEQRDNFKYDSKRSISRDLGLLMSVCAKDSAWWDTTVVLVTIRDVWVITSI